nr:MAG TPA: hypothetical protein [Caudoviricetes sp.]
MLPYYCLIRIINNLRAANFFRLFFVILINYCYIINNK